VTDPLVLAHILKAQQGSVELAFWGLRSAHLGLRKKLSPPTSGTDENQVPSYRVFGRLGAICLDLPLLDQLAVFQHRQLHSHGSEPLPHCRCTETSIKAPTRSQWDWIALRLHRPGVE